MSAIPRAIATSWSRSPAALKYAAEALSSALHAALGKLDAAHAPGRRRAERRRAGGLAAAPVVIALRQVASRWDRPELAGLVVELESGGGALQPAVARALEDPSVQVLTSPDGQRFLDEHGGAVTLDEVSASRTLTQTPIWRQAGRRTGPRCGAASASRLSTASRRRSRTRARGRPAQPGARGAVTGSAGFADQDHRGERRGPASCRTGPARRCTAAPGGARFRPAAGQAHGRRRRSRSIPTRVLPDLQQEAAETLDAALLRKREPAS